MITHKECSWKNWDQVGLWEGVRIISCNWTTKVLHTAIIYMDPLSIWSILYGQKQRKHQFKNKDLETKVFWELSCLLEMWGLPSMSEYWTRSHKRFCKAPLSGTERMKYTRVRKMKKIVLLREEIGIVDTLAVLPLPTLIYPYSRKSSLKISPPEKNSHPSILVLSLTGINQLEHAPWGSGWVGIWAQDPIQSLDIQ